MAAPGSPDPGPSGRGEPAPVEVLREERQLVAELLHRHGWRLLLVFVGLLLPLWGFAELADEVREGEPFEFDEPVLYFARDLANAGFDRGFLLFSALGYQWGVVPFDVLLVAALALKRRAREALFAALALAGSAVLNLGTKQLFARARRFKASATTSTMSNGTTPHS